MTDNQTPVPDSEEPRSAAITALTGIVYLDDEYLVSLDVDTGQAVVHLPASDIRVAVTVITTTGDLIAAMIGAAEQAREEALAGRAIPLVGKSEFTAEEVVQIAGQVAGAATMPLMQDHPDYVFPSERVSEGLNAVLASFGLHANGDGTVDRTIPQ